MGWIIGTIIQFVTYPGVIMQTVALRLFCDVMHVEVFEVSYFSGQLVHGEIRGLGRAFVIALAPFFLNTLLCMVLTFPAVFSQFNDSAAGDGLAGVITLYFGICMGMHAIPTKKALDDFADKVDYGSANITLRVLYKTVSVMFGLFNILRYLWADAAYTLGTAVLLPLLAFWYLGL